MKKNFFERERAYDQERAEEEYQEGSTLNAEPPTQLDLKTPRS